VLTIPIAEAIVGGALGRPSKMPGRSWGIAAAECIRGAKLAQQPGTVCASCYALRGHYITGSVKRAHDRRLQGLTHPQWVEAMAVLINGHERNGYFRWFDAGDLQGVTHLRQILEVARRTPTVRHWLPTREHELVADVVLGYRVARNALPANLVIRLAADHIEDRPTYDTWGLPTATVHKHPREPVPARPGRRRGESIECKAYERGDRCGPCRACWEPKVQNVSYLHNAGMRRRFDNEDPRRAKRSKRLRLVA